MADILGVHADLFAGLLKKVLSLAAEEISLVWGLKGDLAKLKDSVEMIQAFLADAETRGVSDKSVKLWLEKLDDEAYRADDVLDEFAYEIARQKVEIRNQMKRKVLSFFSNSNPVLLRSRMAHKIKKINTSLFEINEKAKGLGLQIRLQTTPSQVTVAHPVTDSLLHESEVIVARDVDASNIVKMLTGPGNQEAVSVIPIVGMAGLGKTTLAKLIYNGDEIRRHFDLRIWVCVSDNFDVERLLIEILGSLTNAKCKSRNEILEELLKELGGKKYILVLDDVWNQDHNKWADFKTCMLRVSTTIGNNILVTTRSIQVASIVETLPKYFLKKLSSEDCWSIFKGEAFATEGAPTNFDLEDIGRIIAEKCNGVPLAAKVAGSIMRSKKDKDQWLSILNDGVWSVVGHENDVLPIIKLSFDHLSSSSLKHCFAYCSLFSKGSRLEKEQLVQVWMAQEFLQPEEGSNRELEDIGNEYFEVLLQSSLFQDIEKDDFDNITHCKMHDLVHHFARKISKPKCFSEEDDKEKENPRVRHLALYSSSKSNGDIQPESAKRLRTLFLYNFVPVHRFFKFKCLRVLNLCGADIKELSSSISELVHLRYLDLSNNWISSLPKSIVELYNLQTLRLQGCHGIWGFPDKFNNLTSLRHLYLPQRFAIQMPNEISWLTSLQTLSYFKVRKDKGFKIEELGHLKNLRGKLDLYDLQEVDGKEEARKADLCGKESIYQLSFKWNFKMKGNHNPEDVLEGLQPSPRLKDLHIEDFTGDKFPLWVMKMVGTTNGENTWLPLNNLVRVRLLICRCELIPMLGRLPLLRDLGLDMSKVKCLDESFYGYNFHESGTSHSSKETKVFFPSLKSFKMWNMDSLANWIELPKGSGVQAFPCLNELSIRSCSLLKSAPSHFPQLQKLTYSGVWSDLPLKKIWSSKPTTLTKLEIERVVDLTSLPDELLQNNKYLEAIKILHCPMLTHVVPSLRGCSTSLLRSLIIEECEMLSNLPDDLNTLPSLETLHISYCPNLNSIPTIHGLTSLRDLSLKQCAGLTCLPSGLESCKSLTTFCVQKCTNVTSFPDIQTLCSLSTLRITYFEKLTFLPRGLQFLTRLVNLTIGPFSKELNSFPSLDVVQHLHASLHEITLRGWPHWDLIPEQLQHLTALTYLRLKSFGVEALPDWFDNLSSLKELHLYRCGRLKYLPRMEAMQRLTKLKIVHIQNCPLLQARCKKGGPEWPKISHIEVRSY